MKISAKYDKDSYTKFMQALKAASAKTKNLRIPLQEIADRFLESRNFIFDRSRRGPGRYKDLRGWTKHLKAKEVNFVYPILLRTGRLAASLTRSGGENIKEVGAKTLVIGTSVPYASKHQEGKGKLPKRPFLFWGPESPLFATSAMTTKLSKSIASTLFIYIEREMGKSMKAAVTTATRKVDQLYR